MGLDTLPWSSAMASDALDELGLRGQVVDRVLTPLLAGTVLSGPVLTVRTETTTAVADVDDPYRSEIEVVAALRPGQVPLYVVPDGNRAAIWGELFSHAALAKGAAGAIVDGYVRDARRLRALRFPVFSLGTSPLDTRGRARVCEVGRPLELGGVAVASGDFVVADDDGVAIVPAGAVPDVIGLVARRRRDEAAARQDLTAGLSLREVWERWQAL